MKPGTSRNLDDLRARVTGLCAALDARAAGYWQLDPATKQLVQLCFVPGAGLDPEVGHQFAAATAGVPLSETSLGIVAAALSGLPVVSHAAALPAGSGSGRWLRAFGAGRSVAVPLCGAEGSVQAVVSVAVAADSQLDDDAVVKVLRDNAVV